MTNAPSIAPDLQLHIGIPGFEFSDLFLPERLKDLTELFYQTVAEADPALKEKFDLYRSTLGEGMSPEAISAVLVDVAPYLSAMIAELFQVKDEAGRMR